MKRDLMAWQLGDLHGEERVKLEAHVSECTSCVREFIALKRDVELAEDGPAPSFAAKEKLRHAVKLELGLVPGPWWERPVAFFVGTASVACALLIVINV
ncbi:MAG: zf-HC2 domain-containing protein [Archangium sp.]